MKILPMIFALLLLGAPAFAAESCLTKDESQRLSDLRLKLQRAKFNNSECVQNKGALACAHVADRLDLHYLEQRESGNSFACAPEVLQPEIDSVGEEAQPVNDLDSALEE